MTEVFPEFDPATKTWFLADPKIEAPTLREVHDRLPEGYRLDPTYRLDGARIEIRQPQERPGDPVQKYLAGFSLPRPKAPRGAPLSPPAVTSVSALERKPKEKIADESAAISERVAQLYADKTMSIDDIAKAVDRSRSRVIKIINRGRDLGDVRFAGWPRRKQPKRDTLDKEKIIELLATMSQAAIAERYGVSRKVIRCIVEESQGAFGAKKQDDDNASIQSENGSDARHIQPGACADGASARDDVDPDYDRSPGERLPSGSERHPGCDG